MKVQAGQLVALGYGKYALSDEVVSVQPIRDDRGPGRRARVWVRGLADPIVASRSEEARQQHVERTLFRVAATGAG